MLEVTLVPSVLPRLPGLKAIGEDADGYFMSEPSSGGDDFLTSDL